MHQFVDAGLVLLNPDNPKRPVNSGDTVYRVSPEALTLLRTYGTRAWASKLAAYRKQHRSLVERYARERLFNLVPVTIAEGRELQLTPGKHSELIKAIIESFAPRFASGSALVYAGDTGDKHAYRNDAMLAALGIEIDPHGKMPDVILHDVKRGWLLLVESVTSHGPVDGKRHDELMDLFRASSAPLVYVTAFPSRRGMARFLPDIAWETEVWVADSPDHLIHFNGDRYLGPHGT
jgi:hypothetical protein